MNEDTTGVLAQARAQAPVAAGQQPAQPVAQPVAQQPAQPVAAPAGFGQPAPQSGFAPQPVAQPAPAPEPVLTDRTSEQFSKLTESNQRLSQQTQTLAQQNEQLRQELQGLQTTRQQSQQQFAPVQQVPTGQQQPSALPKLEDYIEVDPRTGERFVNEARFNSAMADIYQKASRAEQVVQNYVQTSERRELDRQTREAFGVYPQLNPQGEGFDARFSQQTRAIVYDSLINPQDYGGRGLGFREAADFIAQAGTAGQQQRAATNSAVPTPSVNEANQVQKEQAAASAQSTPQQVSQSVDVEREHQRQILGTRLGSDEAIAVRLLNATHRMADVEAEVVGQQAR